MPIGKDKVRIQITLHKSTYQYLRDLADINKKTCSNIMENFFLIVYESLLDRQEEKVKEDRASLEA